MPRNHRYFRGVVLLNSKLPDHTGAGSFLAPRRELKKGLALKKLYVLLAAASIFATACTDPNVTGRLADSLADMQAEASASESAAEDELVYTTPLPSDEVGDFVHIDVEAPSTPVPVFTATPGPSESFAYADSDTINVRYYDMANQKAVSTQYPVSDASDPQVVLEGVQAAYSDILGDQNLKINSATMSDGNLFVDFDPSIYDLGIGSAGERELLESVADTYLTNVSGIQAIFYTVNGEPYNSENISLGENESYKTLGSVSQ